MGQPLVFPMGTVIYKPDKAWNGYTVVPTINDGILMFDMNGNEIRRWNFQGMPPKLLPGGHLMGNSGMRYPENGMQDGVNLVQIDYDGKVEWQFDHFEKIDDPGHDHRWMARQHHDYQREGASVYYSPNDHPAIDHGKTLILAHRTIHNPAISDKKLLDDIVYEVDWDGNIIWSWSCSDHFNEFGFDEAAKNILSRNPNMREPDGGVGDFMHTNCASYLGPNKWYDQGDERFKPNNIIMDSRESNILYIVDHDTGHIVWKLGPDYTHDPKAAAIGQIIGQHGLHMIPKGLPGEGDLLLFDNGGWAGYGVPNPGSKDGSKNALRDYSRVLEINPVTMKLVWSVTPENMGAVMPVDSSKFYSPYVSDVQRLPNGNTMIDEGADGRILEITKDYEVVWEWISPYFTHNDDGPRNNMIYRAYRYPYSYVPQEPKPNEVPIEAVDNTTFRLPNAGKKGAKTVVDVDGTLPYYPDVALCVATIDESNEMQAKKKTVHLFDVDRKVFEEINQDGFNSEVLNGKSDKPQLVMFGAERCPHCKKVHPLLEKAFKEDFPGEFKVYYTNVDKNPSLTESMRITGTPVVAVFQNGKEIERFRGELDYDGICDFLDEALTAKA
ncbi:aryl-sulfate sulfotransferase [Furfurilactobacillus rossiae]|uniref:aryl-sulfate sulfotransferase n=1 Tax=Furfurilactobacillus rossiae TaxID=231049 RepID=UPI001F171756|nr:aryl-sulfate sulfotransferase [Furfurilactobacillus rossiae]MCF6166012.1 aryl-sulfate sulfotransferase [Furfurilactobacillus rossiae]